MILRIVVVGPYQENTYIIGSDETQEAAIIDAGAEWQAIMNAVEDSGLTVKYLLTTHGHEDHIGAVADMVDATNAPFAIHQNDAYMIEKPPDTASIIPGFRNPPEPDLFLEEGDTVEIGDLSLSVIETHGHTPGGISYYGHGLVFTGDTLFRGSVGRTDFEGGNWEQLIDSIKTKLLPLPDDTVVLPGHGPHSSIGAEAQWNPFLRETP